MPRMVFISFPVRDLARARAFYAALGFTDDSGFSDETSAAMNWSDTIKIMLITRERWATFTTRAIPPADQSEFGHALTYDSRAEVDRAALAGTRAGGQLDVNPVEEHDFMYQRDVADPDGHVWGLTWMATAPAEPAPAAA